MAGEAVGPLCISTVVMSAVACGAGRCGLFRTTGVIVALSAARLMSWLTAGLPRVRCCTRVDARTGLLAGVTVVLELRARKVLQRLAMHTVEMSIIPER